MMTGAELKAARLALGLSQQDLAAVIDADPVTLRRWERGAYAVPARAIEIMRKLENPDTRKEFDLSPTGTASGMRLRGGMR